MSQTSWLVQLRLTPVERIFTFRPHAILQFQGSPINQPATEHLDELCPESGGEMSHEDGVSIIVFEDPRHRSRTMAAADVWFKRQQRPVEFIVVAKSESRVVPLSGSPATLHAKSLQAAIEASRFEQIAILDPVYRFHAIHWNLVDPKTSQKRFDHGVLP